MKAMILAAGLGTRLKPLTNDRPKALVEIASRTLLEITLARLRSFGIREVIVNVHHFADMVVDYLKAKDNFGMRIEISREEVLLDTGGGLKKAAWFFLEDPNSNEPFVLHNVDVLSSIDLAQMVRFNNSRQALATLAVHDRVTSRYLLFDEHSMLCGRRLGVDQTAEIVRPSQSVTPLAFSGIHVISSRLLAMLTEDGVFSIIPSYLRLAGKGERILAYRADNDYWRDLGKPENLQKAARDFELGLVKTGS
jgi:NDP-sugar pyrophosphorylase family protein